LISSDTIQLIEKLIEKYKTKAKKYKIGEAPKRDLKIRSRYKNLAKDFEYILKKIKDGQI